MSRRVLKILSMMKFAMAAAAVLAATNAAWSAQDDECVAAPDFEVVTIENDRLALADMKGERPVYLKFWLSTCPQCIAEMPHFIHAFEEYGNELQFIAVNLAIDGDTVAVVRQTMSEHGMEMPVVVDSASQMQSAFGVYGTPTHIVIDRDGRIVHHSNRADASLDELLGHLHEATTADKEFGGDSG